MNEFDMEVGETVIVKANRIPTSLDRNLGFDNPKNEGETRYPGTSSGQHVFKFSNGHYRHGVPENSGDRKTIEDWLGFSLFDKDSADYKEFFRNFRIDLDSDITFLNKNNPEHLLKIYILQADTYDIASSIEEAKSSRSPKAFVLEKVGEDEIEKAGRKKKLNSAYATLADLDENKPDFMLSLAKFIAPTNKGIANANSAYLFLDEFLKGNYNNGSELEAVNQFERILKEPKERIVVGSIVKEAIYKNIIRKEQGKYVNPLSRTVFGISEQDCINFLLKDENQEELGMNLPTDQAYSIREQIKRKNNYK